MFLLCWQPSPCLPVSGVWAGGAAGAGEGSLRGFGEAGPTGGQSVLSEAGGGADKEETGLPGGPGYSWGGGVPSLRPSHPQSKGATGVCQGSSRSEFTSK